MLCVISFFQPGGREIMNRILKLIVAVAALSLCSVKTASATFLYDFTDANAHIEFTVPTILTSLTTETTFLLATFSGGGGGTINAFTLDPVAGGTCPLGLGSPCADYHVLLTGGGTLTVEYSGFPTFTSIGTFSAGSARITISQVVPEPSPLLLVITALGVFLLQRIRRRQTGF